VHVRLLLEHFQRFYLGVNVRFYQKIVRAAQEYNLIDFTAIWLPSAGNTSGICKNQSDRVSALLLRATLSNAGE
jgi:hypothetical protein